MLTAKKLNPWLQHIYMLAAQQHASTEPKLQLQQAQNCNSCILQPC
jgi:hypothetical protein